MPGYPPRKREGARKGEGGRKLKPCGERKKSKKRGKGGLVKKKQTGGSTGGRV